MQVQKPSIVWSTFVV